MIPSHLYDQVVKLMPIPSVEALIVKQSAFLFLRRRNEPAKGQWWLPGGRIRKGETLQNALFREVEEETGSSVSIVRQINAYSRIFPERHDITIVYLCETKGDKVVLNCEHSEYAFFKVLPKEIHPFLVQVLKDLGVLSVQS